MKATSLIFIFLVSDLFQSLSPIDSLHRKIAQLDIDSEEYVINLTLLAKKYAETDPENGLLQAKKALSLAKNDSLKGQIFIAFSTAYSYLASYDSSTMYSFRAIEIAETYKDTTTLIDANNNLGIDFMFQEEDEKAIEYYMKVEKLARLTNDSLRLGHALNNLGIMHGYAEDYQREHGFYELAATIFKNIDEKEGLGNTYLNAADSYIIIEQNDKAENLLKQALQVFEELNLSSGIQNTIQTMAENELGRQNFTRAESLSIRALEIAKENDLTQDVIYTLELLEQISVESGDFKKAHEFQSLVNKERDKVFTLEKNKQITELETKYQTEKKEAEIRRLALENDLKDANLASSRNAQYAIAIGGGLTIALLIVFFTLRNKKQRAEREAQELQLEALKKRFLELHTSPTELAVNLDPIDLNKKLHNPLTEREFDALKLSLEGKSNLEIAEELFISINTVKFHLKNTYGKMGVSNRKEAFKYILAVK